MCWLWWYPWKNPCFRCNLRKLSVFCGWHKKWGLIKSIDLSYAICSLSWDTYLQIMENWNQITFLILPNAQKCINFVHGQTIENAKYVEILNTTCLKHNRFHSLRYKILSRISNVICWRFVSEINSNIQKSKKERRKMISQINNQQKVKKFNLQSNYLILL